jgi:SWI/SNF-related matrix-associated actin-dependent regulator of chromatin subfamily B protein 1
MVRAWRFILVYPICLIGRVDPVVTPENFAQSLIDDYHLPLNYHSVITKSIQDQLSDFKAHLSNPDDPDDTVCNGELDDDDATWWESWRKRLRTEDGFVKLRKRAEGRSRKRRKVSVKEEVKEVSLGVDEIEVDEQKAQEDMRILIRVRLRARICLCLRG